METRWQHDGYTIEIRCRVDNTGLHDGNTMNTRWIHDAMSIFLYIVSICKSFLQFWTSINTSIDAGSLSADINYMNLGSTSPKATRTIKKNGFDSYIETPEIWWRYVSVPYIAPQQCGNFHLFIKKISTVESHSWLVGITLDNFLCKFIFDQS